MRKYWLFSNDVTCIFNKNLYILEPFRLVIVEDYLENNLMFFKVTIFQQSDTSTSTVVKRMNIILIMCLNLKEGMIKNFKDFLNHVQKKYSTFFGPKG